MTYHQITLEERYHLQALRGVAPSLAAIARVLGRHRSTIGRELRRNRTTSGPYRPYPAHCYARTRRSRSRRNQRLTPTDWQQVVARLRQGWSPEQIAGPGRRDGTCGSVTRPSTATSGRTSGPAAWCTACCGGPASAVGAAAGAGAAGGSAWERGTNENTT